MDQDAVNFFRHKKSWSKYKDLILDYYLEPYLAKVARLNKPILVVDCFAGPGKFDDGEVGSPLIISNHLNKSHEKGAEVKAYFIEKEGELFAKLRDNVKTNRFMTIVRNGPFQDFIDELSEFAKTHTTFLYIDPIRPTDLLFHDLQGVYDHLVKSGQSIETLVNFMSKSFMRIILGTKNITCKDGVIEKDNENVKKWNDIAGGDYWQELLFSELSFEDNVDVLATGYSKQLQNWFKYVLKYAVKEKYDHKKPEYHLIFGSRHHDAVELINWAMVKARREFVGAFFVDNMLFDNRPEKEVVDDAEIKRCLMSTLRDTGSTTWKMLRIQTTLTNPSMYTESDFNRNIKKLIQNQTIKSSCSGSKIENDAKVWL